MAEHEECQAKQVPPTLSKMPRRLIDLSGYRPPSEPHCQWVRVVDTRWMNEPYCALSYRWPANTSDLTMLSGKSQQMLYSGFDAGRLHHTIRDACGLCKSLGFRYLWVDALVSRIIRAKPKSVSPTYCDISSVLFRVSRVTGTQRLKTLLRYISML